MNTKLDKFMFREFKKCKGVQVVDFLFVLCLLVLSLIVRLCLFPIETADHTVYFQKWMEQVQDLGGFSSLSTPIGNYTTPYMIMMCAVSYLPIEFLHSVKMVDVIFDYVGAMAAFCIVYQITKNRKKSILAAVGLLFLPTVILNGAAWSQCDMMNVSFMLFSLFFLLRNKPRAAMVFFGIAFSFKFQTIFFLPALIMFWLNKGYRWRYYLWVPCIYLISMVPALLAGRSFQSLILLYFGQTQQFSALTLNYPSIYTLFHEKYQVELANAGMFFTAAVLGCILYWIYNQRRNLTERQILLITILTASVMLFFLPHMHDRYGLFVDAVAFLFGIIYMKKWWISLGYVMVSLFAYLPFLFNVTVIPFSYVTIFFLILIFLTAYELYIDFTKKEKRIFCH